MDDGSLQRILVVDDEPSIRDAVAYTLRREGFDVEVAADGPSAIARARTYLPDLVVLDVMLPGMDGIRVCKALRAESVVPIIFLSARGEEVDRVLGLEVGGDDYLTKPFAMRELIARIRANLRRVQGGELAERHAPTTSPPAQPIFRAAQISIDFDRRQVYRDGKPISMKPKEFDLLAYMAQRPGVVLSRTQLLRDVWSYDFPIDTRTVDVHVRWLRSKLEEEPGHPMLIETVRGVGYRLRLPDVHR